MGLPRRRAAAVLMSLAAAAVAASCARAPRRALESTGTEPAAPAVHAQGGEGAATGAQPAPPRSAGAQRFRVSASIVSGPQPEGDEGFDALKALGVRTIISVDGGRPDLERAAARGMRYVHLPTGYNGVPAQRQAELARAVRDLRGDGPVYIHCHHGKHRGPAAAASAAILLGEMTVEEGLRFMDVAGTSPSYPGLWSSVRDIGTLPAGIVDRAGTSFPEVAPVPGFVEAMVQADGAFEHLGLIQRAGWRTPADHPDLVPAAEAGRLADLLRDLRHDARSKKEGSEFVFFMLASAERARELEGAIVAGASKERLEGAMEAVGTSCRDCHVRYRN